MLNVRFIVKMLGVMFILETFFMLAATVVAFLYRGSDVYPLLISSGILFGTGFLFYSMGFKANEHSAAAGRNVDRDIDMDFILFIWNVTILYRRIYR